MRHDSDSPFSVQSRCWQLLLPQMQSKISPQQSTKGFTSCGYTFLHILNKGKHACCRETNIKICKYGVIEYRHNEMEKWFRVSWCVHSFDAHNRCRSLWITVVMDPGRQLRDVGVRFTMFSFFGPQFHCLDLWVRLSQTQIYATKGSKAWICCNVARTPQPFCYCLLEHSFTAFPW